MRPPRAFFGSSDFKSLIKVADHVSLSTPICCLKIDWPRRTPPWSEPRAGAGGLDAQTLRPGDARTGPRFGIGTTRRDSLLI